MDIILTKLKYDVNFRERMNKNFGIAQLLKEKYHLDIDTSRLKAVIEDGETYSRYWRQALQYHPEYRGFDYSTKRKVVEQAKINLGYEPNYYSNIKKLNTL